MIRKLWWVLLLGGCAPLCHQMEAVWKPTVELAKCDEGCNKPTVINAQDWEYDLLHN